MKVLFIGDIFGEPGRRALARAVPRLVAQRQIDIVIGNGENAAGGFGITPELAEELFDLGLAVITTGNHAWDKKEILDYFPREPRLLRPANYPSGVPGNGSVVVESAGGEQLGVLQLMGRAYMPTLDCPFQVAKKELAALKKRTVAVIVDMHAEATSEKMAMGHYLDGEVVAVVGTHTHVQTADDQILPKGTAYMTDIGMTGPLHSVIGVKKELAIEKFLTGMPRRFEVASGPSVFCAVLLELDARLGKALSIERIRIID
ncbi:MAG TPA: TIGR00282 family metallophosphoesterase [Nitrospiraceae bacterium]|nr:TIGR00282 family metallophosphoesterase [Nitrospiraceae bacterium]HKQ35937.1 TIGR00282 family metallophosphoesterase [Nitrospiraceae bacterium]HSQ92392.1 TIGR00282 family metallophosphoesterase [Nitrospiraceae bacterium]